MRAAVIEFAADKVDALRGVELCFKIQDALNLPGVQISFGFQMRSHGVE